MSAEYNDVNPTLCVAEILQASKSLTDLYSSAFEAGVLVAGALNEVKIGLYNVYFPSYLGAHSTIDLNDHENPVRKRTITIQIEGDTIRATFFAMEHGQAPQSAEMEITEGIIVQDGQQTLLDEIGRWMATQIMALNHKLSMGLSEAQRIALEMEPSKS
ncbi:hypothetical protein COW94_04840 [Candidatus Peregrinibacteria bacterium CG22_combo_CG10-13_8_21_14_all_44_10]|nr:MAG: hypothetical protein AUK45_01040 [Candidatus Peregrinibacteria bacterium CG2_30_44_17]PIP65860.1 MAG: hypothetical protein COW94_04840 [Candidatus Peregrinibacteria bacterium CG22_combo_CG10-13_8_21_14_all_44_10]PIS03589.1 MAG: hypothetical protein COT83_05245 [Candidatus Peregrinibacteria bacterium CG10_big_fil_rev_8_21_14_0_10_44_7]PIX80616.1 MAG: hypothetical protein COZ35_00235 [Candidatus Peregrinibacteria bacterium CG_4_10_14_3_um_filter_44_21]PJB88607.1 MAG: hypothetical protein 